MERLWTLLLELNLFSSGSAATPTWWSSLALPHLVYPHSSPWITSRIRPAGAGISVSEARSVTRNPAADRPTPALPAPTFQVRRRGPQDANAHCSSSSPVSSHSSLLLSLFSASPSSPPLLLFFSLLPLLTTPPYDFLPSLLSLLLSFLSPSLSSSLPSPFLLPPSSPPHYSSLLLSFLTSSCSN